VTERQSYVERYTTAVLEALEAHPHDATCAAADFPEACTCSRPDRQARAVAEALIDAFGHDRRGAYVCMESGFSHGETEALAILQHGSPEAVFQDWLGKLVTQQVVSAAKE
jgi:hypothetical protein